MLQLAQLDTSSDTSAPAKAASSEPSQLQRGLRILELLRGGPRSAASIARELDVHRSTALRLLRELESIRYVMRNAQKEYTVLPERILALVPDAGDHYDWVETINPILRGVRDEYQEATNFSVPAEATMVYMSYYASPQVVSVNERAGTVRPMYCSAIGKAYLAALEEDAVDSYLGRMRFEGGTANAPKGPLEFRDRIEETRKRGYAVDLEETLAGVICVAGAVRVGGVVIGAAGLSAPAERMDEDRIDVCGERLRSAFGELARPTEPAA